MTDLLVNFGSYHTHTHSHKWKGYRSEHILKPVFPSVIHGSAALASPGSVLEMQPPRHRPTESESTFNKLPW